MKLKIGDTKFYFQRGFGLMFMSAKDIIIDSLIAESLKNKDYDVCIYGWSLGSVLIPLFALYYNYKTGKKIKNAVGFGVPRGLYCTSFKTKKIFKEKIINLVEYCQPNDFVCWVNPFCLHINPVWVGDKFDIIKIFNTGNNHCNYDLIDYK